MEETTKLFLSNKAWAKEKLQEDDDYFLKLSKDQNPAYLWIGCSDSRVPANEIIGAEPGELFVHRNIANLVVHTDLNLLSVLQYAVEYLGVKHIILCGHTGCGGVKASLTQNSFDMLNKWLRNLKDIHRLHRQELDKFASEDERVNEMVKLNIVEQVNNLVKTSIVQKAWKYNQRPHIHGWLYNMETGLLDSIIEKKPGDYIDPIYVYDDI